jgi:hypothetical protein
MAAAEEGVEPAPAGIREGGVIDQLGSILRRPHHGGAHQLPISRAGCPDQHVDHPPLDQERDSGSHGQQCHRHEPGHQPASARRPERDHRAQRRGTDQTSGVATLVSGGIAAEERHRGRHQVPATSRHPADEPRQREGERSAKSSPVTRVASRARCMRRISGAPAVTDRRTIPPTRRFSIGSKEASPPGPASSEADARPPVACARGSAPGEASTPAPSMARVIVLTATSPPRRLRRETMWQSPGIEAKTDGTSNSWSSPSRHALRFSTRRRRDTAESLVGIVSIAGSNS